MKRITKGIIAAAGLGTRFLPATRAVPKELLPIVDKPIIQYIVEEFAEAGIKDIAIVTNSSPSPIAKHFQTNRILDEHLKRTKKTDIRRKLQKISNLANLSFIKQQGPYGNGTPCLAAKRFIGKQPFAYAFGDDLVLSNTSFTKQLTQQYTKKPGIYVGVQQVPRKEVHKYGIINPRKGGAANEIAGIVEKPNPGTAPSTLADFGRFLLPAEIIQVLERKRFGKDSELWLVDAITELIGRGQKAYFKTIKNGQWYTTGDPASYLAAVRAYALQRPGLKSHVKKIFR